MQRKMATIESYIASIAYFDGITPEERAHVARHCIVRSYTTGEMIFLEDEQAAGLWVVEAGHVKVFKLNPDGGEHILHLRGPGKTFNDVAALDGGKNPANAAALSEDARVWLIPAEVITYVLTHNTRVALNVIRMLAVRVRSLVGQIEDLALYSVMVRLARFLLKQASDPSLTGPAVTRTAIAAHINTTPQTISNVLHSLADAGAIHFNRQHVVIVDAKILRSIAML
jgi:CRP/FNR family transcriptional regulator, dissimilatory nitrate respiration regulator